MGGEFYGGRMITELRNCPTVLTDEDLSRFRREGYLAFANVLSPEELEGSREALRGLTGRLVGGSAADVTYTPPRVKEDGRATQAKYQFAGGRCFLDLEKGYDPAGRKVEEVELQIRKYMNFVQESAALEAPVRAGHRMHGVVESLLGREPILFQEMALVKPPLIGTEKPWHQDNAYFSVAPLDAVVGVWIALDDAEVANGCMHVIPGGHHIGALRHFHGRDCEIVEGRLDTSGAVAVPIPAGGAMFFYGLLPHETPPNRSPLRRRALQYHFRAATSVVVDEEAYNRVFVERDGTPASCRAAARGAG